MPTVPAPPVPDLNWTHPAELVRVIDGDTFVARIDLGKYPTKYLAEPHIRILGLWCPEIKDPGGVEARDALSALLLPSTTASGGLIVQTRKPDPRDAYGRCLADVWSMGVHVASRMIEAGYGTATK